MTRKITRIGNAMPEKPRMACEDSPEVMFPIPGNIAGVEDAQDICAGCEVLKQCREMAILFVKSGAIQHGVIAGVLVESRRDAALQELKQAAAADRQLPEVA